MKLTGNKILEAEPSKVWLLLIDPDHLSRLVPGNMRLETLSENSFKSVFTIKIGPVSGSFIGTMQLENIQDQKGFTLKAQQNSKIGNANAVVTITLAPVENTKTELTFDGDVKLSGMLASMGQRIIGGVAESITKEFFTNIEHELAVDSNH